MQNAPQAGALHIQATPAIAGPAAPALSQPGVSGPQSAFDNFWKTGPLVASQGTADSGTMEFAQSPEGSGDSEANAKRRMLLIFGLIAIMGGALAYAILVLEWDPVAAISGLWSSSEEVSADQSPLAAKNHSDQSADEGEEGAASSLSGEDSATVIKPVAGNPYWALPNAIERKTLIGEIWTPVQEEQWRSGIVHKYPYQRLKTVQMIRRAHRRGAETILWEALQDKKAWPRLFAAVGLAEYNVALGNQPLLKAIGTSRSELIAGFFERFIAKPNAGQAYIMRQAVRLLDEKGRLTCLRGIWNSRDRFRNLYIAAATLDPSSHVKKWVQGVLLQRSMPLDRFDNLLAMVEGKAPLVGFDWPKPRSRVSTGVKKVRSSPPRKGAEKAAPSGDEPAADDGADVLSVGDSSDAHQSGDLGDVVFFNTEPSATAEKAAANPNPTQAPAPP